MTTKENEKHYFKFLCVFSLSKHKAIPLRNYQCDQQSTKKQYITEQVIPQTRSSEMLLMEQNRHFHLLQGESDINPLLHNTTFPCSQCRALLGSGKCAIME